LRLVNKYDYNLIVDSFDGENKAHVRHHWQFTGIHIVGHTSKLGSSYIYCAS